MKLRARAARLRALLHEATRLAQPLRAVVGFVPATVLTGAAQASLSDAATLSQQLFNGNAGTSEVAAIAVGGDTYVFYASNGGATVDSAIQLAGVSPSILTSSDFG